MNQKLKLHPWTRLLAEILFDVIILSVVLFVSACNREESPPTARIGQPAPVFSFADLNTGKITALSDLKSKVIVVEFWASWCAACQDVMAKMQTYEDGHPEWRDAVVFLAVSIDESSQIAKDHLAKKGWNKTRNVWLNPEGGKNPHMLAYAGQGIPALYVIGPDRVIAEAGRPSEVDVNDVVKTLLAVDRTH